MGETSKKFARKKNTDHRPLAHTMQNGWYEDRNYTFSLYSYPITNRVGLTMY